MPLFRTQSAAKQTSLAPHDSKARLRVVTTRRDSWRSHVHRTYIAQRVQLFEIETANVKRLSFGRSHRPFSFSGKKMGVASRGTCAAKPFAPVRKSICALTGAKSEEHFHDFQKIGLAGMAARLPWATTASEYENTRHNIGFMAAERLIDKRESALQPPALPRADGGDRIRRGECSSDDAADLHEPLRRGGGRGGAVL